MAFQASRNCWQNDPCEWNQKILSTRYLRHQWTQCTASFRVENGERIPMRSDPWVRIIAKWRPSMYSWTATREAWSPNNPRFKISVKSMKWTTGHNFISLVTHHLFDDTHHISEYRPAIRRKFVSAL
jgi:hypothetical protein